MQTGDKGRDRTKVSPFFYFCRKKITGYLQRRLFKDKVPVKKGGGNAFIYIIKLPSMAVLTFRLHWGKQDVSTRINGSASIEVICKIKQCLIGIIGVFILKPDMTCILSFRT